MSRRHASKHQALRRRETLLEQKANPMFFGMTALSDLPQPRTMPKNYRTYSTEGYSNDTLWKVVNYGIQNAAAIPPKLYSNRTKSKEIKSHALLDQLDNPNPEMDGVFYRESILGYYLLAGNSFQYGIRSGKAGPFDELWPLEPDKVKPIPDERRGIFAYQVDYFSKEKNPVPADLIGHLKSWNPKDPFFGMSPVEVAAIIIDQQTAIRKWNLALLQNFAKPPGAWTTTTLLDFNTRQKLEAQIAEKMAGYRNAGKAPVLDGGLTWQSQAVAPGELDWLEGAKYNAGAIANIFNMPPQLIGDTSSTTYDNMEQAKAASYTEYIFVMLDKLYSLWNRWLVPTYPDLQNAYLYYDKESVEVVQQVIQGRMTAASQRANQSWSQGAASSCTLNEAREMQGLPPDPQGDVYRVGSIIIPQGKLEEYAEQSLTKPAGPPMPQAEPLNVEPTVQSDQQPHASQENDDANNHSDDNTGKPANKPSGKLDGKQPAHQEDHQSGSKRLVLRSTKALDLSTHEEKRAYADAIETARKHHEDRYEREIADYFDQERQAVVKAIESSSAQSPSVLAGRANGAINDTSDDLKDILEDLWENVAIDFGTQIAGQLGGKKGKVSDFIKQFGDAQLRYLLLMAGTKIQQITSTTLAKIRLELTEGIVNGESIPQLAKRINNLYFQQIIPNRSTVIVRSEVVASSNWSAVQAAQASGLQLKKVWLATEDNRTRPAHAEADGQEVGMDEAFTVDGEDLQYPGDSAGSPENIIQCRCTVYFKRVPATITTDDDISEDESDTEEEKYLRRETYRKFMNEVLV